MRGRTFARTIDTMSNDAQDETRQFVADHLEVELDDLELIATTGNSCTCRLASSGTAHTAHVTIGPEGPVVTVEQT